MTKEEFTQLGNSYGFFTYRDEKSLFLKPQYMWGDIPVMTFDNGKVKISIKLDEDGNIYKYGADRIIVSEVATARFFLNELLKKRKKILENKKLKSIEKDFQFCKQNFTKNITKTAYLVLTSGSLIVIFTINN